MAIESARGTTAQIEKLKAEEREAVRTLWIYGLLIAAVLLGSPAWWVFSSAMEARAYNRLTGAHATTWDAMWVNLRVQESPR